MIDLFKDAVGNVIITSDRCIINLFKKCFAKEYFLVKKMTVDKASGDDTTCLRHLQNTADDVGKFSGLAETPLVGPVRRGQKVEVVGSDAVNE